MFCRKSCRAAPPCIAWHCQLAWSPDPSRAGPASPASRWGPCAGSLPAQACSEPPPVPPAWSGSWAHMSLGVQSTAAPTRIRAKLGLLPGSQTSWWRDLWFCISSKNTEHSKSKETLSVMHCRTDHGEPRGHMSCTGRICHPACVKCVSYTVSIFSGASYGVNTSL